MMTLIPWQSWSYVTNKSYVWQLIRFLIIFSIIIKPLLSDNNLHGHHHFVRNSTITGKGIGCKHQTSYFVNSVVEVPMCIGQTDQDLKNGMSIINLITSRGYLPTCRILQLLLWMKSEVFPRGVTRDLFVDVGANIGSCSIHVAALGFPVVSIEPVPQHVDTIKGSQAISPYLNIALFHLGISSKSKLIQVNFGHGARNWGASEFHEVNTTIETAESELELRTLDEIIGHRNVALMKVDCEGCEFEALQGAKKSISRVSMIKLELVQPEYPYGNETVQANAILEFLIENNFEIYADWWNEQNLYFGNHGNEVMEVDKMFGSKKFNLDVNFEILQSCAKRILSQPIILKDFNQRLFMKSSTDIIAIEKSLSQRLQRHFLQGL